MAIFLETNNLLNIRYSENNDWNGQIGFYKGFVKFDCIDSCLRAGVKLLRNYISHLRCNTPVKIIERFAPRTENDTDEYINSFCIFTGFGIKSYLRESDIPRILQGLIKQETSINFPLRYLKEIYVKYS